MQSQDIRRVYRGQAEQAEGIVIVIDVIRAFTVAAYAFAGGAQNLWLVRTREEALTLRELSPDALLAGEIGGRLIPGFDLNNSPYLMSQADVRGRRIIQRTGAGTQGAVNACNATYLLVCSLVNARATARYVAQLHATSGLPVTFHPTETSTETVTREEDNYCADYIEALLIRPETATAVLAERIALLQASGHLTPSYREPDEDFPAEDVEKILAADSFDFAMLGKRREHAGFPYIEVEQIPA
jgi:2-phosphosulfolactate phosphatase